MRMTHAKMYSRLLAEDATCNGRFFTGVLTTGIYCLPSCKARKPKAENVRFFPSCEAAREAGLRPCRKCYPDDFARGFDPVLEDMESLVREVRANPTAFTDVSAIVQRSGFGSTRLFELFRQHFHATPAEVLLKARIEAAKQRLLADGKVAAGQSRVSDSSLLEVAQSAGFESVSVFHEHFRRLTGMTPADYRDLRGGSAQFRILLPADYPLPYLRRALSRDPHSLTERLTGDEYLTVLRLASGSAAVVRATLSPEAVDVVITSPQPTRVVAVEVHSVMLGLLGLEQDAGAFVRLARKLGLARLVAGRIELRISQTPSVFDGLLWSIIGQQISFPFACMLKRRLVEHTSNPVPGADGLYAPPSPTDVAAVLPESLLPLQFSRQKADYVVSIARRIVDGQLDLGALKATSATRVERSLSEIRGLGPWSVNYVMMRSLGLADCVPLGDTGVTSGLQALLKLEQRPDVDATRTLMTVFSPYRSLATTHLWQFKQPDPS